MRQRGLTCELAAAAIGFSTSTYFRRRRAAEHGEPLVERRGPRSCALPTVEAVSAAEKLVREVEGHIGAEPLSRATKLSRRHAARVKATTLTRMERERKERSQRVVFAQPGIVRAVDAMFVRTTSGWRYPFIFSDAKIPFRTHAELLDFYEAAYVAAAIRRDFIANGAPLVMRLDRHRTALSEAVDDVFKEFGVLVLHGPPRYPRFYGQLERQNREHRQWLGRDVHDEKDAARLLAKAVQSLNELIPRRTLQWCTPKQAWEARPRVDVDRVELRREVHERAAEISGRLSERELRYGYQHRFAIQEALTARGLLSISNGELC